MIVQGGDLVVAKLGEANTAGLVIKAAELPKGEGESCTQSVFTVKFSTRPDKLFTWVVHRNRQSVGLSFDYMPNEFNFEPYLKAINRKEEVIWREEV